MRRGFLYTLIVMLVCRGAAADLASSTLHHPGPGHHGADWGLAPTPEEASRLVRQALAFEDSELQGLIAERHGLSTPIVCPTCGHSGLAYSLDAPDQLTCSQCTMIVHGDTLPLDAVLSGVNDLGETVAYRCTTLGPNVVAIGAHIRYRRHVELARAARVLAEAFQRDHEKEVADRAVRILIRFADVYAHWPVVQTARPQPALVRYTIGPRRPFAEGDYGRWEGSFRVEIPDDLVFAYDLTYAADAWDALSRECGCDLRRRVEQELFRPAMNLALTVRGDSLGTLTDPTPALWQRVLHLGHVLKDPGVIELAEGFIAGVRPVPVPRTGAE